VPVRRNAKGNNIIEAIVARLPARFYEPRVRLSDSANTDLGLHMADLTRLLSQELGREEHLPTVEVMTMLGIPPSGWYRAKLTPVK
jgi:hypothetical protein